jgi:hypothetical protein
MPAKEPPFMRFLKSVTECPSTGCWLWDGGVHKNGYGVIKVFGKMEFAHRLAYSLYNGPIPQGQEVMHSCDVKHCVNPDHLTSGTHAQNMADAAERKLMPKGSNHPNFGKKNPRPNQSNKVMVLGVEYDSQKHAERVLGLGSGSVRYWLKTGSPKARLIQKGKYNVICE